jgi:hypothetical protein
MSINDTPIRLECKEDRNQQGELKLWREALKVDPDNFIIRSQIWALVHPRALVLSDRILRLAKAAANGERI